MSGTTHRLGSVLGLGLALLSAITFGTSGTFATALIDAGWTPGAAVVARISIAALALAVPALLQLRGRWRLLLRSLPTVLIYGLFAVAGAQLMFFNAIEHLSVGVALLLEYLGVLLVVGWLWLRHGRRPRRLTVIGAVVAVLGLVLVLDLTGTTRIDPVGLLWGLGAAVGLAVYYVVSARTEDELPPLVMAWAGLTVAAILLIGASVSGLLPFAAPRTPVQLFGTTMSPVVPVLCLSLVAGAFAYVAGIGAARMLGATVSSFVGLTEVLAAVVFAALVLGQVPAAIQIAGGVLVLAGVVLVRIDELRRPAAVSKDVAPEPLPTA
jgi:drug/metabolite transporter (DMT)-like permease